MRINNQFIVIEGVDGVGKTTIANLLVKRLRGVYFKTPPPYVRWVARLLDRFNNPEIETLGYILLAIYTSFCISRILKEKSVICDKYVLTTFAAQDCLGGKLAKILGRFRYKFVLKPRFTFCLTIGDDVELMKRLRGRGKLDSNDKQLFPVRNCMQKKYCEFSEVIPIETTKQTPEQVLSIIVKHFEPAEH